MIWHFLTVIVQDGCRDFGSHFESRSSLHMKRGGILFYVKEKKCEEFVQNISWTFFDRVKNSVELLKVNLARFCVI